MEYYRYFFDQLSGDIDYIGFYNTSLDEIFYKDWRVAFGAHRFRRPLPVDVVNDKSLEVERTSFNEVSQLVFIIIQASVR